MTGFGRASGVYADEHFAIEVVSVNHRFLECAIRLPGPWAVLEPALKEHLKGRLSRGKLNVSVRRERGAAGRPAIKCDLKVAEEYVAASRGLVNLMNSTERLSLDTLARLEGVFYQEEEEHDIEQVLAAVTATLDQACDHLETMRKREGEALAADLRERVNEMRAAVAEVETQIPALSEQYENRLRERMGELAQDTSLTQERIALEVAMMADKTAVNEEIVRLKAHLDHTEQLLERPEPIGRELNFVSQEIQREVNTLGSKMRDIGVTREVLRMKSELEKLREQAQNIE